MDTDGIARLTVRLKQGRSRFTCTATVHKRLARHVKVIM
jgi:hypothetical protein